MRTVDPRAWHAYGMRGKCSFLLWSGEVTPDRANAKCCAPFGPGDTVGEHGAVGAKPVLNGYCGGGQVSVNVVE